MASKEQARNPRDGEPEVVLALGGGGARGVAHVGVIRVLETAGIRVRAVAGTSIGAWVGALHAAGRLEGWVDIVRDMNWQGILRYLDPTLPRTALFAGRKLRLLMEQLLGGRRRIEDLEIPFRAVATDLLNRREVWIDRGDLVTAVAASTAIPGVFQPVRLGETWLVDGGILAPVPVRAARDLAGGPVLAVDLNAGSLPAPGEDQVRRLHAPPVSEGGEADEVPPGIRARLTQRASEFWSRLGRREDHERAPGMLFLLNETLALNQAQLARLQIAREQPDLVLRPRLADVDVFDFHRSLEVHAEGERVAREALESGALEALFRSPGVAERIRRMLRMS